MDFYGNSSNEGHFYAQYLNFLPFDVTIKKGEAICQGVFEKYLVTDNDNVSVERNGGLGSTDDDANILSIDEKEIKNRCLIN